MTLSATMTIDDACSRTWDLVVVGAGPAGTIAARQGALAGLRTMLIERRSFPREKVCGGCLNQSAVTLLEQLGLRDRIESLGAPALREFDLRCGRGRLRVSLPGGIAVTRARLDEELARAAVAGGSAFLPDTVAELLTEGESTGFQEPGSHRLVRLRGRDRTGLAKARVIVVADGLGHPSLTHLPEFAAREQFSSRIGLGVTVELPSAEYRAGTIHMAVGVAGYVGATRVEDGRLNIAAALDRGAVARNIRPGTVIDEILTQVGFLPLGAALQTASWHGTLPLTRQSPRVAGYRLLVAGDAAGYIEPFTGEGMAWALAGGTVVAAIAMRGCRVWHEGLEQEWAGAWRRLVVQRQHWCRWLALGLRSPRLTRTLLMAAGLVPSVARSIVQRLNAPLLPAKGALG